ncbi:hypothetical protein PRIPAC_81344, partial [Pristionchus pacificus]|uniref:Nuclear receptor n=1 Tax=Pristionchus pacificus TaxID=54126 RepID=A0A2A6CQH8_PRIPA
SNGSKLRNSSKPRTELPPYRILNDACTVCGKPATGTHYQSTLFQCVSCNGCRSFFRRSIAYGKEYTCKGMGYDQQGCSVRVDEEQEDSPEAALPDDIQVSDIVPVVPDYECKLEKMMQKLLLIEDAHHKLRISKYSPRLVPGLSIGDFAYGPSKLGVDYGPMRTTPYEPVSIMLVPEEVYIKHKIQIDFSRFDYSEKKLWMFQDVTFAIEFIKALPIYHLLDDCSKLSLLASAITCSNFTSAFYSYSHHSDRTCFPDGTVMCWSRSLQDKSPHSTRFHTGLIAAMRDVQLDTREYALLKMIVVCNPMLDGLNPYDATLLQHEKERYTKTLLSYVLAKRGVKDGPAMFTKILSIVNLVTKLTSWQKSQHILILAMGLHKYSCPFAETIFHSH